MSSTDMQPNPYSVPLVANPTASNQHYVGQAALQGAQPTAGNVGPDVVGFAQGLMGFVPDPIRQPQGGLLPDTNATPGYIFDGSQLGKDVEDFKVTGRYIVVGDTIFSGQVVFKFDEIVTEGEQFVQLSANHEELTFSNRATLAGNMQTANYRLAEAQLARHRVNNTLKDVIGKAFDETLGMDVRECIAMSNPIGMAGVEVNLSGGESRASKLGKEGALSGFLINGLGAALMEIFQMRIYGVYDNIAPPGIPIGSHIWVYLKPVKIYNGEKFNCGGSPMYGVHRQDFPYDDASPLYRKDEAINFTFSNHNGDESFIYVYQWQVGTSTSNGFDPMSICPIDWELPEYRKLSDGGAAEVINHPGYYQKVGVMINPPTHFSNKAPERDSVNMEMLSRDIYAQRAILGDGNEEGNMFMFVNFNDADYF